MFNGLVIFGVQTSLDLGNTSGISLLLACLLLSVFILSFNSYLLNTLEPRLNRKVQREQSVQTVYSKGEIPGN